MVNILTIVGARPQFIKASVVSHAINNSDSLSELVLHTGQHYDKNMSNVFFDDLGMRKPDIQLNINGGSHGYMTGRMLIEIEKELIKNKPDIVLVYGDTNSTLAGALSAAKLNIPLAHVEAGLRSFNPKMPEEVNRILTDQMSNMLFCPTDSAMLNLENEGFDKKDVQMLKVGDVMQDASIFYSDKVVQPSSDISREFVLATLHRAENTDDPERLSNIVSSLNDIHNNIEKVVLPIHPRTKKIIDNLGLHLEVDLIDPVGYLEMLWLLKNCKLVLTDSGGVQKEAYFFNKYCVTMRDQTEWVELVDEGVNFLVGASSFDIYKSVEQKIDALYPKTSDLYGGGAAARRIIDEIARL